MTRPVRFVSEYALAAAAAAVVSALINWDTTLQTSFPAQQGKMWLTRFTSLYLQWLVMRRHFGWASQWALASLGEYAFSGLASPLMTWLMPLMGQSLAWFPTRMLLATPQAIVLASRARLPWLWPVVQAALSVGAIYVTAFWRPAYPQPMSLGGRVASGALAVLSAALAAAVLAWMCRDELERNVEHPPAATATRLEFLIGWVAMHLAVIAIVMATPEQVIGRALILHVAIVVYSAAYIAGTVFVLSTTGEDWKAWLPAPAIATAVILMASLTPVLYLIYIQLLSTKWAVLGLALSLSQWFAIRRWSWGVWWLLAAIVGWSSAIWLPRMVNAAVGPGQLYRYPLADTPGIYTVAGLLTGLALIVEMRRGTAFAK